MRDLTCEEVLDSLGAYALGALDASERDAVEAHLAECADCRAALEAHQATIGALASAVPAAEPAGEVRSRLIASISTGARPKLEVVAAPEPAPKSPVSFQRWLVPALSTAATLLLVGVGVLSVLLARAVDQRDSAQYSSVMLSEYTTAGGTQVDLLSQPVQEYNEYPWQGTLLTAPGKRPVVVVAGCPKSAESFTYYVWMSKNGDRTGFGKLTVKSDGSGWLYLEEGTDLTAFDTIGITVVQSDDEKQDVLVAPLDSVKEG